MITYILIGVVVLIALAFFFKPSKIDSSAYKNVSITELDDLLKDKNTVLIDVRTPRETNQGMIGQPMKIELGPSMQKKLDNLDKDKKYVVYCRSGRRSVMASKMMSKLGFEDVNNLLGGYLAWKDSN